MKDVNEQDVLIFSDDAMIGRLLDHLFVSQGLTSGLDGYSEGLLGTLNSLTNTPKVAIFDLPYPPSSQEKPCQLMNKLGPLKDTGRIILSTQRVDCSACSFYLKDKCEHLQKPFVTGELVGKVKAFLP